MKIDIKIDVTPEELRRSLGLPDLGPLQEQWLEGMADGLASNVERQGEFFSALLNGGLAPWRSFMGGFQSSDNKAAGDD